MKIGIDQESAEQKLKFEIDEITIELMFFKNALEI